MTQSVIVLFDLDGTLCTARKPLESHMVQLLKSLRQKVSVGIVSGSDEAKLSDQLNGRTSELCDFLFVENGLVAYRNGALIGSQSISSHMGEDKLKRVINFVLRYFSDLDIPKKRGTFIEYRTGMMNFSPIGRNCSYEERLEFAAYDAEHGVRKAFKSALEKEFCDIELSFSIGGQISIDCFPTGWDKTYCLRYLDEFKEVHFFGDATGVGGNDYEIYSHHRTIGHSVRNPAETVDMLKKLFGV